MKKKFYALAVESQSGYFGLLDPATMIHEGRNQFDTVEQAQVAKREEAPADEDIRIVHIEIIE